MMKRTALLFTVFLLIASVACAADYKKDIVGGWTYEFGGVPATVDHKADGTFVLVMKDTTVKGTYTVTGNKLALVTDGKKTTTYTIEGFDGKKMTLKRDKDGRTIVYTKK